MLFSAAMAAAWAGLYFLLFGGKGLWRDSAASGSQLGLLLVIYAFLGLATLAKGPAGFLLPLLSLAVFLGLTGRLDLAARFRPITGALVLLAVVLPWYGLCTLANGWGFVEEFLIRHNLERFLPAAMSTLSLSGSFRRLPSSAFSPGACNCFRRLGGCFDTGIAGARLPGPRISFCGCGC